MERGLWGVRVYWQRFVKRATWWPYRRRHLAGWSLTPREHQLFCEMLAHAFMEVRSLAQRGKADQVASLGYAMNGIPYLMTALGGELVSEGSVSALQEPEASEAKWEGVRERLKDYQHEYPREEGGYWDYLGMLNLMDKPA